jgi:hypothetical protein
MSIQKRELESALGKPVTVTTGALKDSDGSSIKSDAYLTFVVGSTTYYIPLYDTTA